MNHGNTNTGSQKIDMVSDRISDLYGLSMFFCLKQICNTYTLIYVGSWSWSQYLITFINILKIPTTPTQI